MVLATPLPALAVDLGGTAWSFDGYVQNPKLNEDVYVTLAGRRKPLSGSSCCEAFEIAFPTNDSFSLRHRGYEIATGQLRTRKGGFALKPDAASEATLLWWLENEVEFFWNIPVFDLGLRLRLDVLKHSSLRLGIKTAGGQIQGTLKLNFGVGGSVLAVDPTHVRGFAAGRVRGTVRYAERASGMVPIEETSASPYPPIVPCESDSAEIRSRDFTPQSWSEPDYCR
jgi:hypothetical protein